MGLHRRADSRRRNPSSVQIVVLEEPGGHVLRPVDAHPTARPTLSPRIAVSQGGPAPASSTPGQVTVIYDDFNGSRHDPLADLQSRRQRRSPWWAAVTVANAPRDRGDVGRHVSGRLRVPTRRHRRGPSPIPAVVGNRGIGPEPVIAADNTLGNFSQFQGRLYVAYVGRNAGPADNTDIYLSSSRPTAARTGRPRSGSTRTTR